MKKESHHSLKLKKRRKFKPKKFWKETLKSNRQTYIIDRALLSDYLEENGYRKLDSFGEVKVVQLIDNIAYLKTSMDVYTDVLKYIKKQENDILRSCFINQGENLLVTKKAILGGLPEIEFDKYQDTKEHVKLFYQNKIVTIRAEKVKIQSYKKFSKSNDFILSSQLIDREFKETDNIQSDFELFIRLATNDEEHFTAVCTAIGYLISNFKNPSVTKAVIITDILSQVENEAYGRSGKGLIIIALSHVINVVQYNGKVTDLTNDKFVFQNVNLSTSLIVLQDVTKSFLFESLFSSLTDVLSIERKHRDKINVPFQYSPKIALTTNYTIPQDTDSFKDRKYLLTLNNFFNAENKPEKHLGKLLFDWTELEWFRFDNFIVKCVQLFLSNGLIQYDSADLKLQKLINLTSKEFVQIMNSEYDVLNEYWRIKDIAVRFDLKSSDASTKSRKIAKWIDSYASFKGYKVDRRGSGGITKFCFIT